MAKIGNAPDGERTVIDGTEKIPLGNNADTSSYWSLISTIKTYMQSFFVRLTGNENIAGNKTFTGYTSFHIPADSDVVGSSVYVQLDGNDYGIDIEQFYNNSANGNRNPLYIYRDREGNGNLTAPMIFGEQYNNSSDSSPISGDFMLFSNDLGDAFNVDENGSVNIALGQTYKVNGSPHTHSAVSGSFTTVDLKTVTVVNGIITSIV